MSHILNAHDLWKAKILGPGRTYRCRHELVSIMSGRVALFCSPEHDREALDVQGYAACSPFERVDLSRHTQRSITNYAAFDKAHAALSH